MENNFTLTTPVVFIIFNRPEPTKEVFESIRRARPSKLYIIADGPRDNRPGEHGICQETRRVTEVIDWPCEVFTDFAECNLGCKQRVITGLNWVFSREDEAIILEDDCLPSNSFFQFCQETLSKYRHDTRIMSISGDNFKYGGRRTSESYYFSIHSHIWGWATWKRAWSYFDGDLSLWQDIQKGQWLHDVLNDPSAEAFFFRIFQDSFYGKSSAWSYAWVFACFIQSGLCIIPNRNLVSNIGYGNEATHTTAEDIFSNIPAEETEFPLVHPKFVIRNSIADLATNQLLFQRNNVRENYMRKWLTAALVNQPITGCLTGLSIQKVALFGTLETALSLSKMLKNQGIEVVVFLDNNPSKHYSFLDEVMVVPLNWLADHADEVDMIISTVLGTHEINIIDQINSFVYHSNTKVISWMDLIAWHEN